MEATPEGMEATPMGPSLCRDAVEQTAETG
jgi:hypothetical protein